MSLGLLQTPDFLSGALSNPPMLDRTLSGLYVPVHFVPRAIWTSMAEKGTLVDHSFTSDAPYSPRVANTLDGGQIWMAILGYLIGGSPYLFFRCHRGISDVASRAFPRQLALPHTVLLMAILLSGSLRPCIPLVYLIRKRRKQANGWQRSKVRRRAPGAGKMRGGEFARL